MLVPLNLLDKFVNVQDIRPIDIANKLSICSCESSFNKEKNVLECEITPNRGDLLSVLGISREVSAIFDRDINYEKADLYFEDLNSFSIDINTDSCKRYIGAIIKDVKISDSPSWLKKDLESFGLNSINNIVDITNYIMMLYGHPLHAFDLSKIKGKIIVRKAKNGEKIRALDDKYYVLDESITVIADEESPIAIAGIIGGKDSSISNDTTDVFLEGAFFDPVSIRKASKFLKIQTESSYRFERYVDIEALKDSFYKALELIIELTGAKVIGVKDIYKEKYEPRWLFLRINDYVRLTGKSFNKERIRSILEKLGFEIKELRCGFEVKIPSHRAFDIKESIDIIEEIERIEDINKLEKEPLKVPSFSFYKEDLENYVRSFFVSNGFYETINIPFEKYEFYDILELDEKPDLYILNPLNEEEKFLRSSLITSLLKTFKFNYSRGFYDQKIFEIATCFNLEKEELRVGFLVYGKENYIKGINLDGYYVRSLIDKLFFNITTQKSNLKFLHDYTQSFILQDNKKIGYIGRIHPAKAKALDVPSNIYLGEFTLYNYSLEFIQGKELSKLPYVYRDLALIMENEENIDKLIKDIRNYLGDLVEDILVFDIYRGEKIKESEKSVGMRFKFRPLKDSLNDEEVNEIVRSLLEYLKTKSVFLRY